MAFVGAAAHDDLYGWLYGRMGDVLGPVGVQALADTRWELRNSGRPDITHVESGRWRARLEVALADDPALSGPVEVLIHDTRLRLREVQPSLFGIAGRY